MTLPIGPKRARAILIKHGLNPEAEVEALTEAIEARGWHLQVDRDTPGNQDNHQRAYWAQAIQPAPPEDLDDLVPLSATGPTARDVLMIVLAKVLRQEHPGPGVLLEQIAEDWTEGPGEGEP